MNNRRPARSRVPARTPRPRAMVGSPRRTDSSSQVRPTFSTLLRHSLLNGKLAALFVLVGGVWGLWYVLQSPRFLIRQVEVVGNRSLQADEVAALAAVQNASIWKLQTDEVAARVATNSYVMTASVQILVPDRVIIRIRERTAVIVWNAAGILYEISAEGEVLGPARTPNPAALVIYDTRPLSLTAGSFVDPDALDLAQTLNLRVPAELGFAPARYEWDPYYGLSMYHEHRQIALGRLNDRAVPLDVKLATLKPLVQDGTEYQLLDLRSAKPYYRPPTPTVAPSPTP